MSAKNPSFALKPPSPIKSEWIKLTFSRPFLLRRALPSQLRDLQPLQPVLFLFIPRHEVELGKLFLDVLNGGALARVVGGEGRSF